MSPKRLPIKLKVALVIFIVSGAAFSAFFFLNYRDTVARIHTHTEQLLERDHKTHARYIQDTLTTMRQDAETLIGFPPISGILRTRQSAELTDPLDGSSLQDWLVRLETLFKSVLTNRSGYSQIRLLLPENNWSEVVRVNFVAGEVSHVAPTDLQQKGDEPYIRLLRAVETDDSLFSNVTRNREKGSVVGPPTLRSIKRLVNDDGAVIGAVVINAVLSELLSVPEYEGELGRTYYVIQNHVEPAFPLATDDQSFVLSPEETPRVLDFKVVAQQSVGQLIDLGSDENLYLSSVPISDAHVPFDFFIATDIDAGALFQQARHELWRNFAHALVLTLLASGLGYVFAARLLSPLEHLIDEIKKSAGLRGDQAGSLSKGGDEVTLIANNFKQLTSDLVRETQRLDMVLTNVAEGIVTLLPDGTIEDANPASCRILDEDSVHLTGRNLFEMLGFDEEDGKEILCETISARGNQPPQQREISLKKQAGEPIVINLVMRHTSYAEGSRFVALIRDVTERAAATARSEALIAALRRSNAELDQFAYIASHDLKAPLRVIENAVSWLEEDLRPHLTDDTRESMDLLRNRARRMEALLSDLLKHSRIGRVADSVEKVTGVQLSESILELLDVPENIRIVFSDDFYHLTVQKMPLETVLVNLIGNSIKHHDRGSGFVSIDVEHSDRCMRFRVEDDGPGIEPAYHDRIFDIFRTLRSRDQLESSGMGLAIVKKHIEVVGGKIDVLSDGERGTVFEFSWPDEIVQEEDKAA